MLQFGATVGDSIKIGDTVFLISGRLLRIPGENALFSDIQPRVYIPMSYLDNTRLIQRGSRVTYTAFFRFAERDVQAIAKSIRPHTRGDRLRLETIERRKARLGRTLNNLYRFLNLGSFIALLLGGVGVASAIHTYTRQKLSYRRRAAQPRCHGPSDRLDLSNPSRGHGLGRLARWCPAWSRSPLPAS